MPEPARTMCDLFARTTSTRGDRIAVRTLEGDVSLTWRQYAEQVARVAAGLQDLGVERGDTVGLMLTNRPEFHLVDAAAIHLGAVPFSGYNTNTAKMIRFLVTSSRCRVFVCERQFLDRVQEAVSDTEVEHLVVVDAAAGSGLLTLADLEDRPPADLARLAADIRPDDVLTIIYTSGTTGDPKGVEITHANMLFSLDSVNSLIEQPEERRIISYLPDAHALNRYLAHYYPMYAGAEVTTVPDPTVLLEALTTVRPTIFVSVPMLWYKLKATVDARLQDGRGLQVSLARWALAAGRREARRRLDRRPASLAQRVEYAVARRLVLHRVAARLGLDRCTYAVTGAAPIAIEAMEFVLSLGIPLCEAWGMTEVTAVATLNRPDHIKPGTVGQAIPGVEVRVAEDGELLVRGAGVMRGYHGAPERTAEAVVDGWMHTGDVGTIDDEGFVTIIDRKKELIINSAGKNMSPAKIENTLKMACPLVGSVAAIGDERPFVSALIALDADLLRAFAEERGVPYNFADLSRDDEVLARVAEGVERANEQLARVEQIRAHVVLDAPWEPAGDELTPSLKLRRRPIAEKYAAQIERLYADAAAARAARSRA